MTGLCILSLLDLKCLFVGVDETDFKSIGGDFSRFLLIIVSIAC